MAEDPEIDQAEQAAAPTTIEAVVDDQGGAGQRLDRFLQQLAPDESRNRLQDLIREGHVTLNERPCKPSATLRPGDRVRLVVPPLTEPQAVPQDIPLTVLYEDSHLIVIDKASGMVVHPAAGNPDGTVVNALLHHCQDLSGIGGTLRPGIVHRLDKDTSGCLVAAKTDAAHRALAAAFAGRTTRKFYLAAVQGRPGDSHGLIRNHLGRHPVDRQRMTVLRDGTGKEAVTEWHSLCPSDRGSLVLCRIFTGRTHQIRVHLRENVACPILNDPIYGSGAKNRSGEGRLMLHAWRLEFPHPSDGRNMCFEAAIPEVFVPWTISSEVQAAMRTLVS